MNPPARHLPEHEPEPVYGWCGLCESHTVFPHKCAGGGQWDTEHEHEHDDEAGQERDTLAPVVDLAAARQRHPTGGASDDDKGAA